MNGQRWKLVTGHMWYRHNSFHTSSIVLIKASLARPRLAHRNAWCGCQSINLANTWGRGSSISLPDSPISSVLSSHCPFVALAGNWWLQEVHGIVYKAWDFEVTEDTEKQQNPSFSCLMTDPAAHYPSAFFLHLPPLNAMALEKVL